MNHISPEFYQILAQNASIGLHIVDKHGVIIYINSFFAKMLGYTVEDMMGKSALDFVDERDKAYLTRSMTFLFQKNTQNNPSAETETRLVCANGRVITVVSTTINLSHSLKKNVLYSITRDITEDKENEEILKTEQNFLKLAVENTKYSFFLINKKGTIGYFNETAKKFHRLFLDFELKAGQNINQYNPFQQKPELFAQYIKSAFEEGKTISYEQILQKPPYNETSWSQVTIQPVSHANQPINEIAISIINTSGRRRAEIQLLENKALLEVVFNNALHGVFLLDKNYKILMFNDKAKQETMKNWRKYPKLEESFLNYVNEIELELFKNRIHKCFQKNEPKYIEAELTVGKDNYQKKIWYEIYYSPLPKTQEEANLIVVSFLNVNERKHAEFTLKEQHEILKTKEEETLKLNKKLTNGRAELMFLNQELEKKNKQIIEQQQNLQNALEQEQNLNTELILKNQALAQQEEELKTINENLRNKQEEMKYTLAQLSDRNFELDQLIYRTSHDIRSPLASVLGIVNVMRYEEIPPNLLDYIDKIESSIKKLDNFTNSMLAFGKTQRTEKITESIDFEVIIQKCWEDLQYMPNFQRVDKKVNINIDDTTFVSDNFRMEIIFANIISNAIKYQDMYKEYSFLHINITIQKKQAYIQFKDNGIGIAKEYLSKIFDMFVRATNKAEGSGLGLYIVKQTIEKLGGKIQVESQLDEGTEITIWL